MRCSSSTHRCAEDVRRMQPYSGGNPLVEADIAIQEGRFRLTKQFYRRQRASVVDLDTGGSSRRPTRPRPSFPV